MRSSKTFFFYDLETSGVNPRSDRIMQFAGQRTDMDLNPIGEPYNILVKMSDDILPQPDAVLITGITPQKTISDGITEAEFCRIFYGEIAKPDTIFVGFNSIRFDDEFMRFTLYRNFRDPYEWQWKNGCSRWDILDLSRMTRALRPEGIEWPFDSTGKPTNRLEFLSSVNELEHIDAHDALSDVKVTIEVARLIKQKQSKLFGYLLGVSGKKEVEQTVMNGNPFVYSSGKYPSEYEKTTVVHAVGPHPDKNGALVFDLRHDPKDFIDLSPKKLAELWRYDREEKKIKLPVKSLQFNRCPAIAPLGVLDEESLKRLSIDLNKIQVNFNTLKNDKEFYNKLTQALNILNSERTSQTALVSDEIIAENQLYDNFIPDSDRRLSVNIINASPEEIMGFKPKLKDERLRMLLLPYKARNYKSNLDDSELGAWEEIRTRKLTAGGENSPIARFGKRLQDLAGDKKIGPEKQFLLEELHLYGLAIGPDN